MFLNLKSITSPYNSQDILIPVITLLANPSMGHRENKICQELPNMRTHNVFIALKDVAGKLFMDQTEQLLI